MRNSTAETSSDTAQPLAKHRGPVSLGNEIQRIRTVFKFAFEDEMTPQLLEQADAVTRLVTAVGATSC